MYKVDPSFQWYLLTPHSSYRNGEPFSGVQIIWQLTRTSKHESIEFFGHVWTIFVGHCPHRSDHASETSKLHSRSQVYRLVRCSPIPSRRVTGRQHCELCVGSICLQYVEQRKCFVQGEVRLKGVRMILMTVAGKVNPCMVLQVCENSFPSSRLFLNDSRFTGNLLYASYFLRHRRKIGFTRCLRHPNNEESGVQRRVLGDVYLACSH